MQNTTFLAKDMIDAPNRLFYKIQATRNITSAGTEYETSMELIWIYHWSKYIANLLHNCMTSKDYLAIIVMVHLHNSN